MGQITENTLRSAVAVFTTFYFVSFATWFIWLGDREYIWYVILILMFAYLGWIFLKESIPAYLMAGLSLAGLMHMVGRALYIDGDILYNYTIPIWTGSNPEEVILKYDQFLHMYGYAIGALIIHYLIKRYAPTARPLGRAFIAVLAVMGIGALNEIAEFAAVISLDHTYVGEYYNTALDLVANAAGAVVAICIAELVELKKEPK